MILRFAQGPYYHEEVVRSWPDYDIDLVRTPGGAMDFEVDIGGVAIYGLNVVWNLGSAPYAQWGERGTDTLWYEISRRYPVGEHELSLEVAQEIEAAAIDASPHIWLGTNET